MTDGPVLVTGGGGQLASDLEEQLGGLGTDVHAPARSELDIADDRAVVETFADLRPTVVFNCAAFHNVDLCEREEDRAFEVNARAVKRLAARCAFNLLRQFRDSTRELKSRGLQQLLSRGGAQSAHIRLA